MLSSTLIIFDGTFVLELFLYLIFILSHCTFVRITTFLAKGFHGGYTVFLILYGFKFVVTVV